MGAGNFVFLGNIFLHRRMRRDEEMLDEPMSSH